MTLPETTSMPALRVLAAAMLAMALPWDASAQIRTDTSLGKPAQNLTGPSFLIPESLGRLSGSNLFHSFQVFNINAGQSANFTTSTAGLTNVISRVTGGSSSQINGLLKLTSPGSTPNFFLVNPAGVTFGTGAAVNVPGAFFVSTADYVKFPDGNYYADTTKVSTFSSVSPSAFGFLGNNQASVTLLNTGLPAPQSGAQGKADSSVFVNRSSPISIVAGDVTINNSVVGNESGDIRVVALGKRAQEVPLTGDLPAAYGSFTIIKGGKLVSSTTGSTDSGSILVSAGAVSIDQQGATSPSIIASQPVSNSTGNAGSVLITATGDLDLLNGATINVSTNGSGNAGSIDLRAANVTVNGNGIQTLIQSETINRPNQTGSGDAGTIVINTPGMLTLKAGGQLNTSTSGSGDAGSINIDAGKINIDPMGKPMLTGIFVNAQTGSQGAGGTIDIVSDGLLSIAANGRIVANTFATGNAGAINVNAGQLTVNGGWIASSAYSSGNAGSVRITTGSATLDGLGTSVGGLGVLSETFGAGNAGTVDMTVAGKLEIQSNASINTSTVGSGKAGSVKVAAGSMTIDGGTTCCNTGIQSNAMPNSTGDAGNVDVSVTGTLAMTNSGLISSATNGQGNAGTVNLTAGDLSLLKGSQVTSATYSANGAAGAVQINTGTFLADGTQTGHASGVSASAGPNSSGQTGTVSVTATGTATLSNGASLTVQNDAQVADPTRLTSTTLSLTAASIIADAAEITASTSRNVPASDIKIKTTSGDILLKNNALIKDKTTGSGDAGLIDISAAGNLTLLNGGTINGNTSLSGNAAAISVSAANITLDGSGRGTSISSGSEPTDPAHLAEATGKGGAVVVNTAGALKLLGGGQIQSSSMSLGDAGSVSVTAGSIMIDNLGSSTNTFGGIFSTASSSGNSGSIQVKATGDVTIRNQGQINATANASGNAGIVNVDAGNLTISDNGWISSDTAGAGKAGTVTVKSGNIALDSGGKISSTSVGNATGDAGSIAVTATGNLSMGARTAITTATQTRTTGNAGSITVDVAKDLSLLQGGQISSATSTPQGAAGSVLITTGTLLVDGIQAGRTSGISASAATGSSGQTGTVSVTVSGAATLSSGATLSVQNDAQSANPASLTSTTLSLTAASITADGAQISASTSRNIPASDIKIKSGGDVLFTNNTQIKGSTTGAGDAGLIDVSATGNLTLSEGAAINGNASLSGNAAAINVTAANITLDGNGKPTSILTSTVPNSQNNPAEATGKGGAVTVSTAGALKLLNGGQIQSSSATLGDAGSVAVTAGSILVDNQNGGTILGGIYSTANSQGNSGSIQVKATGDVTVRNKGQINATTYAKGNAGIVNVAAGALTVSGSGWISSDTVGAGKAGTVTVMAGNIGLDSGGKISSTADNNASNDAGSVTVTATGNLTVGANTAITTATQTRTTGDAGSVTVTVAKDLSVLQGGQISSATSTPSGVAGSVLINTGTLLVDGILNGRPSSISASAATGSSGQTGTVSVSSQGAATVSNGGTLSVQNDATAAKPASLTPTILSLAASNITVDGGQITASTSGNVAGSDIKLKSTGGILLKNNTLIKGKTSGSGDAGLVEVNATGDLTLLNGTAINGNTSLSGNAGAVNVTAANITLDGVGKSTTISSGTEATDQARLAEATGKGGVVVVNTPGALKLLNGGQIQSSSMTKGAAGSVTVNANSIVIDAGSSNSGGIFSTASASGNSGSIQVKAHQDVTVRNQGQINATTFASGDAGIVGVESASLTIAGNGWISSDTTGAGKAGTVTVKAGNIALDSGGKISSTAANTASGDAGSVAVTSTGNMTLGADTAITTATQTKTTGNAGSVVVNVAKDLALLRGGQISSATSTPQGAAGSVRINAETLVVDGAQGPRASSISASATVGSSGQTGNIDVVATNSILLSNGGKLAVQNDAFVASPGGLPLSSLQVSAPQITLKDAQITAASSGNMPASSIKVSFSDKLALDPSRITTSSNLGNGGAIDILGGRMLVLENSQITTSVAGTSGNGGNINVSTNTLLMLTGFIQANTAARNASGGDVAIAAQNLVTSGNVLMLGGQDSYSFMPYAFGFNVIQAAAPTGLSGAIRLTSPALDVSASLIGLNAKLIDTGGMGRSPCQATGGSSLVQAGRGGMPASTRDLLGPQAAGAPARISAVWPTRLAQTGATWECRNG
ncbi:MAG: filamentous hemagglutinin N-terminal domain-containing protein [Sterolibacterium sp.]